MIVNDLFIKGNKLFLEKNFFGGLDIFKEIWVQFPKNKRLEEEINKKVKRFKTPIIQTHSKKEIENFFNLEKSGKSSIVPGIIFCVLMMFLHYLPWEQR